MGSGGRSNARMAAGLRPDAPAPAASDCPAVGADLRRLFDDVTREPMPPRLVDLCDRLEDAFRRGELYGRAQSRRV